MLENLPVPKTLVPIMPPSALDGESAPDRSGDLMPDVLLTAYEVVGGPTACGPLLPPEDSKVG